MSDVLLWEIWYPEAGATGLPFLRAAIAEDRGTRVLVHSSPPVMDVVVRQDGRSLAQAQGLRRQDDAPMCRLVVDGDEVRLEEGWPTDNDLGTIVLLPGGEAGELLSWSHEQDHSAWRWQVEFFNHR